jgi:glycosyltransferase involved in cell wall biosynthesis
MFIPEAQYPLIANENYKRCWTKDINNYYQHYKEIDILLVPLVDNDFNNCKSQLKVIESAFSNTAVIASNTGPYTIDLVNAIEKGGAINENGNALLVDPKKNHKEWVKYITKCANDPKLVEMLKKNLHKDVCETYDLRNVTNTRAEFYKNILNK